MAIRPMAVGTLFGFEVIQKLLNNCRKGLRGYLPAIRFLHEEGGSLHEGGLLRHLGHDLPGVDEFSDCLAQVNPEGGEHLVAELQKGSLLGSYGANMRHSIRQLVGKFFGLFPTFVEAGALHQFAFTARVVGEQNLAIPSIVNWNSRGLPLVHINGSPLQLFARGSGCL